MHLFYVDESGIESESGYFFFSALGLEINQWKRFFSFLSDFRKRATNGYGLFKYKEWHASAFVMGRGRLGKGPIHKSVRLSLYNQLLDELALQNYLTIINVKCGKAAEDAQIFALNCLINRIETFLRKKDDLGMIIMDSGHEREYRTLYRKLHVINMVPSKKGEWNNGSRFRNMPLRQFVEDMIFADSAYSWPLQIIDFIVYALGRRSCANEKQISFGLDHSFEKLRPILCMEASPDHPLGIVEI